MTPLRRHLTLLGIYVLGGLVVTAADGPLLRGSFIDLSGVLPRLYWLIFAFVAVVSTVALLVSRRRGDVVVVTHIVAGSLALPAYILFLFYSHHQAVKVGERDAARTAAAVSTCSRLVSWRWEERTRGNLHLFLKVQRGITDEDQNVVVFDYDRLSKAPDVSLPPSAVGDEVVVEVVASRTDPEPFRELGFYLPCPFAALLYRMRLDKEVGDSMEVQRPLPPPARGDVATGVLQGYDLVLSWSQNPSSFLLRPASNQFLPGASDARWVDGAGLETLVTQLPPHQTIHLWLQGGRDIGADTGPIEAMVARRGHTLVKHVYPPR